MPIGISPETYGESLDQIRSLLAEAERDLDTFDFAYYIDAVIDEDENAAIDEARVFYDRYYLAWDRFSDEEIRARGAFGSAENLATRLDAYDKARVETMIVRFTARDQRTQLRRFANVI